MCPGRVWVCATSPWCRMCRGCVGYLPVSMGSGHGSAWCVRGVDGQCLCVCCCPAVCLPVLSLCLLSCLYVFCLACMSHYLPRMLTVLLLCLIVTSVYRFVFPVYLIFLSYTLFSCPYLPSCFGYMLYFPAHIPYCLSHIPYCLTLFSYLACPIIPRIPYYALPARVPPCMVLINKCNK